jgi:polyhydroxyalkanoate synthase
MNLADDNQNPKPRKPIAKSLASIAALRSMMEMKLAQAQKEKPDAESPAPPSGETRRTAPPKQEKKPAPETEFKPPDPAAWSRIMFRIAERSEKLMEDYIARTREGPGYAPGCDPAHLGMVFLGFINRMMHDPKLFAETQISLWQGYAKIWQSIFARLGGTPIEPAIAPTPGDKRFQDEAWQTIWLFDFIKQSYLLTAGLVNGLVRKETEGLDPKLAHKIDFYTNQMVDAASPSNFWLTNPEVLRATFESGGENLVKGLENLLTDLERGKGELRISMSDPNAFKVGGNLAITKGKVIFQNELMQLIQYAPLTAHVKRTPLLIIPPWINKYYILDLREKNSFIRYLVEQGHTVFCISWVNPDGRYAETSFGNYLESGALAAMQEIKRVTGEEQINVLGYCIGGTLLAMVLAYLKVAPQPGLPTISSATFLVALTDFSEPGDLGVFIDEDQIKAIEVLMAEKGYLEAGAMSTTFNLLRANDLVWSFVINNYLLGKEPFPFDILYWNSDSTNLPAAMHSFYLRKLYMENRLVEPGGVQMKGVPIDLRSIDTPIFMLSTHDDHIAPWHSTYAATQLYKGPVKFVLSGSGHIAGIVNPPANNKYGYWTNDALPPDSDDWFKAALQHAGSWWPEWTKWLDGYGGGEVPAREVKDGLEDAPGSYVKVRAS